MVIILLEYNGLNGGWSCDHQENKQKEYLITKISGKKKIQPVLRLKMCETVSQVDELN